MGNLPTPLTGFTIEELSVGAGFLISPGDLLTGASPGGGQTRRKVTTGRDRGPDTHSPPGSFPLFFFLFVIWKVTLSNVLSLTPVLGDQFTCKGTEGQRKKGCPCHPLAKASTKHQLPSPNLHISTGRGG